MGAGLKSPLGYMWPPGLGFPHLRRPDTPDTKDVGVAALSCCFSLHVAGGVGGAWTLTAWLLGHRHTHTHTHTSHDPALQTNV